MNADKALELARLAYPNDENLCVAYMLGLNAGAEWQKEHSFKPTQKQLNALDTVYKTHGADSACRHVILNLLNQLKSI